MEDYPAKGGVSGYLHCFKYRINSGRGQVSVGEFGTSGYKSS
jgi:hypothetical protein